MPVSFQYLPYMYLSVLIYSVSYILKAFRSREIRLRMNASPVSPTRQLTSGTAAFLLLFLVFWGGSLLMPLLIGTGKLFIPRNLFPWYLGNTLCLLISAASLAFFIGTLVQDDSAINALANSIGLGYQLPLRNFCSSGTAERQRQTVLPLSAFLLVRSY